MLRKIIRILFFTLLMVLVTTCRNHSSDHPAIITKLEHPSDKSAIENLLNSLQCFKNNDCFREAIVGYMILDYTKGLCRLISEMNATMGLVPASIQKLFTTSAALEIFGDKVNNEVTLTNQMSINWRANRLMQKIGQEKYGQYNFQTGIKAVKEYWKNKGIDTAGMVMLDGSGRSHDNIVTPKQIADVLYRMTTSHTFPVFYNSLPLAGFTGTMHKWLTGTVAEGRLRAKTGSLGGVRSYAGYVSTISSKKLIFVIIVNNYSCRTKTFKKVIEDVMVRMTEL